MQTTYKNYLISQGQSNQNVEGNYKHLNYFLNWAEEENLEAEFATSTEIISYIQYLKKRKIKQRTVQIYIGSLKHYYTWLIKREIREENPIRNIDIKGIKRQYLYYILKKQELETLYHNFKIPVAENSNKNQNWYKASQLTSKRNKVIIGLMIWQGLGTQELSSLEEKDVRLREGTIYIAGTRRSNERTLKLESHQILDLMEYTLQTRKEILALTKKESTSLLISVGESHNFKNSMQHLMQILRKQNTSISSHQQIRSSVITHWLKTCNLREVQYMAGHRYVSSTEAYLINDLDGLQEDITKYHPIG